MKSTRREHLASIGTLGLLSVLPNITHAIEPLKRAASESRFRLSLAAYSYRNLLTGSTPKMTLFDFIDDCVRFGIDGTELTSYYFEEPTTDEYLRRLKRHCFLEGIDISGTAIRCDFGVAPGPKRNKEIADVKRWIDRAEILSAPVIRIFAGHQPKDQSAEQTHQLIVDGITECCQYAGDHGIYLALENHGGPTGTAEGLLKIVSDVDSDWFGVNLDTGNFHTETVYEEIEAAAPYATNVQVKVVTSGPDEKKRPTDFARIAKILKAAKYQGYVVLEYEEDGDPRVESERYLNTLRTHFG